MYFFRLSKSILLNFDVCLLCGRFMMILKRTLNKLQNNLRVRSFDLKTVNKLSGDLFFSMYAIKFREERILYPIGAGNGS